MPMNSTDVVFAITGDVRRNSRAIKQLHLLRALGFSVTVLTLGRDSGAPFLDGAVHMRYLPRPKGSGPRFFFAVHRIFRSAALQYSARVFHASDLYCLRALRRAAHRCGARLVYDARELYTHVASTAGRPWVRTFWHQVERSAIGTADAVFTVSDSIAARLQQTYGIARPQVLHNVPPLQQPVPSGELRQWANADRDAVLVLHQGNIQKSRGCFPLLDAWRDVQGATLMFLGGGPLKPALMEAAREHRLQQRVQFASPVPPDALLPVTADADLGIALLEDMCLNHRYALPNKLFEYLMAGVPVIASDLPEMRRVVKPFDVGTVVNPSDRPSLVRTLQRCIDDAQQRRRWQANAHRVFEHYSWSIAAKRFSAAYSSLLP